MGFALWVEGDTLWCAGTHEYRPMGVAIIASTDLFAARDFDPKRQPPSRRLETFAGLYASLNDVNAQLRKHQSHGIKKNLQGRHGRLFSIT